MPRKAKDVTDTELAILRSLWNTDRSSVRSLAQQLYPNEPEKQIPTVQKLLGRLEAKDCVTRDRGVWPHLYSAAVQPEDLVGRRLEALADQLCGGSFGPLLAYILFHRPLGHDERAIIQRFNDESAPLSPNGSNGNARTPA